MDEHKLARNLRQQEPGQGLRHTTAAGTLNIAPHGTARHVSDDLAEWLQLLLHHLYGPTDAQTRTLIPHLWETA